MPLWQAEWDWDTPDRNDGLVGPLWPEVIRTGRGRKVGSKVVQVKGVMLLSQPNPEKHRPAKPSGDSGLNTLLIWRRKSGAGGA